MSGWAITTTTDGVPTCQWPKSAGEAEKKLAKLKKQGASVAPVKIEGRTHRQELLGQILVHKSRTLQRL